MAEFTPKIYKDFSGGLQNKTSYELMKDNELNPAFNVDLSSEIGAVGRCKGFEQVSSPLQADKPVRSLYSYWRKTGEHRFLATCNNSGDTAANLKFLYSDWSNNILTTLPVNCKADFETYMDNVFMVGYGAGTFLTTTSMLGLTTSTSVNVYNAPKGKYIKEFGDRLYIGNCQVDSVNYSSRVYYSSLPMKVITYVNGDQSGNLNYLDVDSAKYLKTGMVIDIYTGGTNTKIVDSRTITDVNTSLNRIYFDRIITSVVDKDEIYLEDRKDDFNIFWDTDNDYLEVASDDGEEISGLGVNINRLLIFKRNSLRKWDGAQLSLIADDVGTVSHWTIKQLSTWTLFFHDKGVYGISGTELKLLSRKVEPYIKAIIASDAIVAGIDGENYNLWIGETQTLNVETTTTSTSSTSTSSTSSSTSTTTTGTTTSTSSTSKSTSTSSTSSSTSSTSSSTSSTSSSTSSTSTSSSTIAPTHINSIRLVYDFGNNAWSTRQENYLVYSACSHKMNGINKLYFGNELGRVYRDNVGNSFAGWPIPMRFATKRFDAGKPDETKRFTKIIVKANKGAEAIILYSLDGGQYKTLGQVEGEKTKIEFPAETYGDDISFMFTQSGTESPMVLYSVILKGYTEGDKYDI